MMVMIRGKDKTKRNDDDGEEVDDEADEVR